MNHFYGVLETKNIFLCQGIQLKVPRHLPSTCFFKGQPDHQAVWPEVEQGLAKAGVETISIWSDPMDDCALYMHLGHPLMEEMGVGARDFCLWRFMASK